MFNVFGFYKFKKLKLLKKHRVILQNSFIKHNIRGTLIISKEGLNGTISGKSKDISFRCKENCGFDICEQCIIEGKNIDKSIFDG